MHTYMLLYYTILYYTILYYTILYHTILYYTILYYTILYYTLRGYTCFTCCFAATHQPFSDLSRGKQSSNARTLVSACELDYYLYYTILD